SAFRERGRTRFVLRRVPTTTPTLADLNLPESIASLVDERRGLILVTGPAGTGKTTTIAAIIGLINGTRRCHIVTIEDPVEVIHLFPAERQRQVRLSLASTLRGVVCQRLLPRSDGGGRVPAVETLVVTGRVRERILDPAQTDSISEVMREGGYYGMQTFDQSL